MIEMIGVLAVIAILAAVLVPKVFSAIANSRVSNTSMSCNTVKQGIADHYAKYNILNYDGTAGTNMTVSATGTNFDNVLVKEGFLDKPFAPRIGSGTGAQVVLLTAPTALGGAVTAAATPAAVTDASFDLSGSTTNTVFGSAVAVALIPGVTWEDAKALNAIIDGAALGEGGTAGKDIQGRVKYDLSANTAGTGTVYVYLTHR